MTQDFAKPHKSPIESSTAPPRWVWFVTGFSAGSFITFLAMLWYFIGPEPTALVSKPVPEPNQAVEEMQWDFYEIFPKSVVPLVEEYNSEGSKVVVDNYSWIVQAGSFQNPDDADHLRAELILMGFNVATQETRINGTDWHRVVVGPFDTELERNRAQDKLAQAQIKSIPMKIPN